MNIVVPRSLLVTIAGLFSGYLLVLAATSFEVVADPGPVLVAMSLYAITTGVSLASIGPPRMTHLNAGLNVAVAVAMVLLVTSVLDPGRSGGNGYATWYVGAVGTLMTITATRGRYLYAWLGVAFLVAHTIAWSGIPALVALGTLGSVAWVAVAQLIGQGMVRASDDARRFALAAREAAAWRAMQEAHTHERQVRLGQTSAMALAMLRRIEETGGDLSAEERRECVHLEAAIRDEIRGRRLLNDAVRGRVMAARRAGVTVTLLDEGGLDDLEAADYDRVLAHVAEAVRAAPRADRLVIRTVTEGAVAVTVVGLRSVGDADGIDDLESGEDDEVELWMEIPRTLV